MALGVEFASVIAKTAAVDDVWPGGLDAFVQRQPNYVEDGVLLRVGFMGTGEALALQDELIGFGVASNAVAVVQHNLTPPDWLSRGEIDGVVAVWPAGTQPGSVIRPATGFALEGPNDLIERFSAEVGPREGIACVPVPQSLIGGDETWRFRLGEALVDVDVVHRQDTGRCRFWGERDHTRRAQSGQDSELCHRLLAAFEALGAQQLG